GAGGLGVAGRLARAGEDGVSASRDARRAADAAATIVSESAGARVSGVRNCDAAVGGAAVVVAIPAGGIDELLQECAQALRDKVVLEVVNSIRVEHGVFRVADTGSDGVAARSAPRPPGPPAGAAFDTV